MQTRPAMLAEADFGEYRGQWGVKQVNHLWRRGAFGLSWERLQQRAKWDCARCVEELLGYDPEADPFSSLYEMADGLVMFSRGDVAQAWWLHRMVLSPWPSQEKVALFWHNRFATSLSKVENTTYMMGQIDLFRRKGLGSFRELLIAVAGDPAMLVWLDGRDSRKGKPNENFGREILELFTLGPGNYSEGDIQELARCFTGWRIEQGSGAVAGGNMMMMGGAPTPQGPAAPSGAGTTGGMMSGGSDQMMGGGSMMGGGMSAGGGMMMSSGGGGGVPTARGVWDKKRWDEGEKTVFGEKGAFDTAGAVDVILRKEGGLAAGRFLARKMLEAYVHPRPPKEAVEWYAGRLVEHKWEIKPVLREMLSSRWFYSDDVYRSKIKSPVELCVSGVMALGGRVSDQFLREQTGKMGQSVLYPPNVKGWDGEEAWINANTVMVRFNYGMALATQRQQEFARRSDLAGMLSRGEVKSWEDLVGYFTTLLLDGEVADSDRERFLAYCREGPPQPAAKGKPASTQPTELKFSANAGVIDGKVRGLIHLVMSMPEYQLA